MENNIEINNDNANPNHGAKRNLPFASIAIVVLVLIIGFILFTKTSPQAKVNDSGFKNNQEILAKLNEVFSPIKTDEHILGNPTAKVFIVEYSDTECPYCKLFHNTMHRIINDRSNDVAWVYRHYPIEQLHQLAFREALASECAWAQGGNDMFWAYIDEIYKRTNSNDSLDPNELYKIASDLSLDSKQFTNCMDTEEYKTKVENDIYSGQALDVRGTPTSFIVVDGKIVDIIPGAQKYETIIEQIDTALQQ